MMYWCASTVSFIRRTVQANILAASISFCRNRRLAKYLVNCAADQLALGLSLMVVLLVLSSSLVSQQFYQFKVKKLVSDDRVSGVFIEYGNTEVVHSCDIKSSNQSQTGRCPTAGTKQVC